MKKLVSIILAVCMLLSLTAAFAEGEKETVTVWCWDPAFNLYAMEEAAKIYNAENPDVVIDIQEVSSDDVQSRLRTYFQEANSTDLPDIVLMQDNSGKEFCSLYADQFVALDEKIDLTQFASYKIANFVDADDNHYSVPFDNGAAAFFYRADVLAEAGYTDEDMKDITWDRFIEIGVDVKTKTGKYLVSSQGYGDIVMMMAQSAGTWFFDEDGDPQLDDEIFETIIEQCKRINDAGIVMFEADWNSYIAAFNSGEALGTINGCWIMASVQLQPDQSGCWGMTTLPRLDYEGATNYSNQGGSSWMVLKNAKNPDTAVDFLAKTFAGSVDLYNIILPSSSAIATYLPAAEAPAYNEENAFFRGQKVFAELMDYAAKIPAVTYGIYNYDARDAITAAFEKVVQGGDIEDALDEAQQKIEYQLEQQ